MSSLEESWTIGRCDCSIAGRLSPLTLMPVDPNPRTAGGATIYLCKYILSSIWRDGLTATDRVMLVRCRRHHTTIDYPPNSALSVRSPVRTYVAIFGNML